MSSVARAWVGCSALALSCWLGCSAQPEPGPLDAGVVSAMSLEQGDAEGLTLSGTYVVTFEEIDCGCDQDDLVGFSTCVALGVSTLFPQGAGLLRFVQGDGRLSVLSEAANVGPLIGPLDQDGTFSGGIVLDVVSVIRGELVTRIDGEFDELASEEPTVSGTIRYRADAVVTQQNLAGEFNETRLNCIDEVSFEGIRVSR